MPQIRETKYAQYNLGRMYQYAMGVSKDLSMAKVWYEKSANQGFDSAQNSLGNLYYSGR